MTAVPDRSKTLFNLRYAVRVLERYARFWHRVDLLMRIAAVASGMSAFAALWAQTPKIALWITGLFALLQAIEFVVGAPKREQAALAARAVYASVLARQSTLDDAGLADGYAAAVAEDEVIVLEGLRYLAYNDVVTERGDNPAALYPVKGFALRLLDLVA